MTGDAGPGFFDLFPGEREDSISSRNFCLLGMQPILGMISFKCLSGVSMTHWGWKQVSYTVEMGNERKGVWGGAGKLDATQGPMRELNIN